jgi:hypothetical protein
VTGASAAKPAEARRTVKSIKIASVHAKMRFTRAG